MNRSLIFDPAAPEVMDNPFPVYKERRAECPLGHVVNVPVPYYVVFRYEDVQAVQTDQEQFTVKYGTNPSFRTPQTIMNDGAEHLSFRRLFQSRLMPQGLRKYRQGITAIANDLIDRMQSAGNAAELYEAYATPLPVKTITMILGNADEDYLVLKKLADQLIELSWTPDPAAYVPLYKSLCDMFDRHIDARLARLADAGIEAPEPAHIGTILPDDSISDIVCGKPDRQRYLTRSEMHYILMALFLGGNETTTFLITNCIWRLLEDRTRWEALQRDTDGLMQTVIEESLRHDPPNLGLWRTTACPVQLHGEELPPHSKIQMSYAAANRDPSVFSDPDSFRLDRPISELRKHLTFGGGQRTMPSPTGVVLSFVDGSE